MRGDAMPHRLANRMQREAAPRAALRLAACALLMLGSGAASLAAEPVGGLASTFRPQSGNGAPAGDTQRANAQAGVAGLRTVVSGQARPVALIDGRVVHEGDVVNGQRVRRITRDEVVLGSEDGA